MFREINGRQRIALLIPPAVAATMIPVFRLLSGAFENAVIGWYLGLVCYWLTWCAIVALKLVGKQRLKQILRPQKPISPWCRSYCFPQPWPPWPKC